MVVGWGGLGLIFFWYYTKKSWMAKYSCFSLATFSVCLTLIMEIKDIKELILLRTPSFSKYQVNIQYRHTFKSKRWQ